MTVALIVFAMMAAIASVVAFHERKLRLHLEGALDTQDELKYAGLLEQHQRTLAALLDVKFAKYFGGEPIVQPTGEQVSEIPAELRALGALTDESLANGKYVLMTENGLTEQEADAAIAEVRSQLIAEGAPHT